jgi:hypothetical protein
VHYFDRDEWFKNTPTEDHIAIFSTYLDLVAEGLQSAYPNLNSREAQGLILKECSTIKNNGANYLI